MKFITKLFLSVFVLAISFSASSQTQSERDRILATYNLNKLQELKAEALAEFEQNRQEALDLAATYNWPEHYELENGGVGYLIGVVDGQPIYYETLNKSAGITARVDRVNSGGTAGLDLNGEDMLIGIWDGGKVRESHELLEDRAIQIDASTSFSSHATHVTGTAIGSSSEVFQSGNAQGMAPAAESINYAFNVGYDAAEVIDAISDYGLLVSNHSYGVPPDGGSGAALPVWVLGKYTSTSRLWDNIQYDSPYYLPVWAAGNARGTNHNNTGDGHYDLLTNQGVSKNNLVVAATYQVLDYVNPSSVTIGSFSSWGPPDDGRVKPDISAKGVGTLSSSASSNSSYASYNGTSMASPSVAGALLLLQQHYNDLNSEFMLSSSLRGLVIHTADEAGSTPGPDYRFGWGLINTERAAEVITNNGTDAHIMELTLENGQSYEITGTSIPGERLVSSITWTDKRGNVISGQEEDDDTPMLVNDLDLRVIDDEDNASLPWVLNHLNFGAAATQDDNYRDNVEKVEIDAPDGDYTIRVSHKGVLDLEEDQVFSLIITGLENINVTLSNPSNALVEASIYPNPANNELNVQAQTQISEIEILNLLGQSMGVQQVESNSTQIDISNFNAGTYFLRVTIDNASKVYKFIKR